MDSLNDRMRAFFLDEDDGPAIPRYTTSRIEQERPPPESNNAALMRFTWTPRSSASRSSISNSTISTFEGSSINGRSFASTAASIAPPRNPQFPPWHQPIGITEHLNDLPCEFSFVGCFIRFHASDVDGWLMHSISHFADAGPPPKAICTFCDYLVFDDPQNRHANWRKRMLHIYQHFSTGAHEVGIRPDFWVVNYLKLKSLMSREDYDWVSQYTERPLIEGLVPLGFKTDEMIRREERGMRVVHDLSKEIRSNRRGERNDNRVGKGRTVNQKKQSHIRHSENDSQLAIKKYTTIKDEAHGTGHITRQAMLSDQQILFSETIQAKPPTIFPDFYELKAEETPELPTATISETIKGETNTYYNSLMINDKKLRGPGKLLLELKHEKGSNSILQHNKQPTSLECAIPQYSELNIDAHRTDSDTNSTTSSDKTDWGGDNESPFCQLGGADFNHEDHSVVIQNRLAQAKTELVNRLMEEFWEIFNQKQNSNVRHSAEGSTQGTASDVSAPTNPAAEAAHVHGIKRRRDDQEDDDLPRDGGRAPRRIEDGPEVPDDSSSDRDFACPYRKRNPRKYRVGVSRWKSCALTPHKTVARLKAHLYKYHVIHQCVRCKHLFQNNEELDMHNESIAGCNMRAEEPVDGITRKIKERLQSRKKTFKGQTGEEKWAEIYDILFPYQEGVRPSPYFEPVRDLEEEEVASSPDSNDLLSYENFLRRELPRVFRSTLEREIDVEINPIEERFNGRMEQLIERATEVVFSMYRTMHTLNPRENTAEQSAEMPKRRNSHAVDTCCQPVLKQQALDKFKDQGGTANPTPESRENDVSDSGYVSNEGIRPQDSRLEAIHGNTLGSIDVDEIRNSNIHALEAPHATNHQIVSNYTDHIRQNPRLAPYEPLLSDEAMLGRSNNTSNILEADPLWKGKGKDLSVNEPPLDDNYINDAQLFQDLYEDHDSEGLSPIFGERFANTSIDFEFVNMESFEWDETTTVWPSQEGKERGESSGMGASGSV